MAWTGDLTPIWGVFLLSIASIINVCWSKNINMSVCSDASGTIYDFDVLALDGKTNISMATYRNKVVLIANVATF